VNFDEAGAKMKVRKRSFIWWD